MKTKYDFSEPYPARPHAFYAGRIISNKFKDEVGMDCPKEFRQFISDEGIIIYQHEAGGLYYSFDALKDIIVLNMRAGVIEPDDGVLIKWLEQNKPEVLTSLFSEELINHGS